MARWARGGGHRPGAPGVPPAESWFPEDPRGFGPRLPGGLLDNLYQNIPPSHNGQGVSGSGGLSSTIAKQGLSP